MTGSWSVLGRDTGILSRRVRVIFFLEILSLNFGHL